MKKLFAVILFCFAGKLYATDPRLSGQVSNTVAKIQQYNSQAVYQSSETCGTTDVQTAFISSPSAAALFAVNVTSAGQGDAKIELFDGGNNLAVTNAAQRRIAFINTRSLGAYMYNVSMSSMIGINNQAIGTGAVPACVQIIYRVR